MYEDTNLEDWPEDDYRIFCYNLGNEVTDEMLAMAFRRFSSYNKCRVKVNDFM
jgi:RNA recognition motif-containing protein